jgi:hypothetical protein
VATTNQSLKNHIAAAAVGTVILDCHLENATLYNNEQYCTSNDWVITID